MTERVNPRSEAGIFSIIFFGYTLRLFRDGFKRDLEEEDLYGVTESCGSKKCGDDTEKLWDETKSVYKLLWTRFGREYSAICFATVLWTEVNSISQPYGQSKLISYFEENQTNITKTDAYYCAGIVIVLKIASVFFWRHIFIYEYYLSIKIRASLKSLLYRKALRLSPAAFSDTNLGNIVTIFTKDIDIIENNLWILMEFVIVTLQTITVSYLLWKKMGDASYIGIGLLCLVLPTQIYLSSLMTKIRLRVGKYTDARLLITQETLSAIKIIKMYSWEKFFTKNIAEARKKEVTIMIKGIYLKYAVIIIAWFASTLTFLILILSYIWMGYTTSTEMIFYVLTLYEDLKLAFGYTIPLNTSRAAEFRAALVRLNKFLNTDEIMKITEKAYEKPSIELEGVTVKIKDEEILKDVCVKIDAPGLTLVTGPVGSGKSSLLKAMLQEYNYEGKIQVNGTVSYASQDPWLFPASVKDNILFGQKYKRQRYQEVIRVCALEYDFSLLESGDETIVADKGINLSKGQQARVNLARAVYKSSDIYLLDDSLTALDIRVQNFIFKECISRFLGSKICVLVTQNVNHLNDVEKIITLKKGHTILSNGSTDKKGSLESLKDAVTDIPNIDVNKTVTEEEHAENKVYSETKKIGKVELTVYKKYFELGGGLLAFGAIMLLYTLSQFVDSYSEQLLTDWVDLQQAVIDLSANSTKNDTHYESKVSEKDTTFNWFTMTVITGALMGLLKFYVLLKFCRSASINIHRIMSSRVVNGVMSFFDTHFLGNILNRFSYDLYNIDESLPFIFPDMVGTIFYCAGSIILLTKVNWIFFFPSSIFIIGLMLMRMVYIPTGRSLKRLEASTRSPLVGLINSSLEGLTTIRAFKADHILKDQFDVNQDDYTSAYFTLQCTMTGFEFFMDALCAVFTILVVLRFILFDHEISAGNVGLALTQVFLLTQYIQWGIRLWADIENNMTSVERVLEYTGIKNEELLGKETEDWPNEGCIIFENVCLKYESTTRPVLKNISFSVKPGQNVGIVGRTGAGKSSIISTLFRLYEFEGKILIDGIDTKELSLNFLSYLEEEIRESRKMEKQKVHSKLFLPKTVMKNIAIIPQDPVLFTGTIRSNIDPNNLYSDEEIWSAIQKVQIKHLVSSLDMPINDGGCTFSMGQKQLLCLARAAIGKYKIVVLDEATANMDADTDKMLHSVIKQIFADCTVLMIAHRLESILECDKVLVMNKGELIEFDTPSSLLRNSSSVFYSMCKESGVDQ